MKLLQSQCKVQLLDDKTSPGPSVTLRHDHHTPATLALLTGRPQTNIYEPAIRQGVVAQGGARRLAKMPWTAHTPITRMKRAMNEHHSAC